MLSVNPAGWQRRWREAKLKGQVRWQDARQAWREFKLRCRLRVQGLRTEARELQLRLRVRAWNARSAWREQRLLWSINYGIDVSLHGVLRCCRRSLVSLVPMVTITVCALLVSASWRAIAGDNKGS